MEISYNKPCLIKKDNQEYLGIPITEEQKKYFYVQLEEFRKAPGWIVNGDKIEEWRITGITVFENCSWFYGPYFKGKVLDDFIRTPGEDWIGELLKLVSAVSIINEKQVKPFRLTTMSVLSGDNNSFLFLPPSIVSEIVSTSTEQLRIEQREIINHPDALAEEFTSYTFAVICYKIITGEFPFYDQSEDNLRDKIRTMKLLPIHLRIPGINQEVSLFILKALKQKTDDFISLSDWDKNLRQWQADSIYCKVSETEIQSLNEQAQKLQKKFDKDLRFKVFLKEYSSRILAIFIISAVLFVTVGTSVYNIYFKARSIKGLLPYEVVKTYYRCFNELDYAVINDCFINDAGKDDANVIMNLYVLTRPKDANSKVNFISAPAWITNNRIPLRNYMTMFGVYDLKINQITGEDQPPVFETTYEKWYSQSENDDSFTGSNLVYLGEDIKERLYFKQDRGDWVIYKIERLQNLPLEYKIIY